jgi:hypothetical protein
MRAGFTAIVLGAVLSVAAATAAPALAASSQPIADCNAHGKLTQTYTVKELRTALATMPADVKEYTNCYDVIQQSLLTQLGGSKGSASGGGSSGGSTFPTWLIVVLVLLALSALTLGAVAVRRRNANT